MGRISEAWPSMPPPGAICKLRSPVRFPCSCSQIEIPSPVESEPMVFALWLSVPEKRLIQNVGKTHVVKNHIGKTLGI
jgi:hypothetical protein